MRLYSCQYCSLTLFFENTHCGRCGSKLGYWAETDNLCVLEPEPRRPGIWTSWTVPGRRLRRCANSRHGVCNWMVDASSGEATCSACRHNRTVPSISTPAGLAAWHKIESAKHKLFASFHRLGLAHIIERAEKTAPLAFHFLDDPVDGRPGVMTGHTNGIITIAAKEADDAEREQRRVLLGEPYRTLLGHFRHETGHYFWDRLVRDRNTFDACRSVFGDHNQDYQSAVGRHYLNGAPSDWKRSFVSAYATMHPWEDFAETWAHYLHMVETLDTAHAYQLQMAPPADKSESSWIKEPVDPYAAESIDALMGVWLPLTMVLNSLNSAMGKDHAYPFVLTGPVIAKLGFVHRLIKDAVAEAADKDPTLLLVAAPVQSRKPRGQSARSPR